jgi:PPOX class probable F420-dependent enzyme
MHLDHHVGQRLLHDRIGWLTTVGSHGQPQSSPVWFLFDDGCVYIQSQPGAAKVRNIQSNNRVSFHLDDDGRGGDVVTIEATAETLQQTPAGLFDRYANKYADEIRDALKSTPAELAATYASTIRLTPSRARSW